MIGDKWKLKVNCLGCKPGDVGYVFNEYEDMGDKTKTGIQLIFKNGCYDGFSYYEQCEYLEFVEEVPSYQDYDFQNVLQVWRDYVKGYWIFED